MRCRLASAQVSALPIRTKNEMAEGVSAKYLIYIDFTDNLSDNFVDFPQDFLHIASLSKLLTTDFSGKTSGNGMRNRLRDSQVKAAKEPGRLSDGDGLYLAVSKTGSKSWVFMWTRQGNRRELGLGSAERGTAPVTLAQARIKAEEVRSLIAAGQDPFTELSERKAAAVALTFGQMADQFIDSMRPSWSNPKHADQWVMTLTEYAKPIRSIPIKDVDTAAVLKVLKPIWQEKPETASWLRGRIEKVLDHARAKGLREGENPARWRGHLDHILPASQKLSRGHHAAMPYKDVPAFMARLAALDGFGARALELTILTASRTNETLGARWDEIDLQDAIWTIPAERMKSKRAHRVPLSEAALEVVKRVTELRMSDFLFPGQAPRKPLSNMAMNAVLKRLEVTGATVHGFRSAFRDWAGEETSFPREIAEQALAHVVGDDTERAYRRGDALAKRRDLMNCWSAFIYAK